MKNLKQLIAFTTIASLALTMVGVAPANAAVSAITINDVGTDFTVNNVIASAETLETVTTVSFTTTSIVAVDETIKITINGVNVSTLVNGDISIGSLQNWAEADYDVTGSDATKAVITMTIKTNDLTQGTQSITIAANKMTTLGAGNYAISVVTPSEVGTSLLYVGDANTVQVSATVEPTLSLVLTDTAVDLGVLSTGDISESATDPTATVATNATGGFTLSVADLDGYVGLYSTTATKLIAATGNNSTVKGTEGFDIVVSGTGTEAAFWTGGNGVITGSNQAIASSTGPVAENVSTINVRAAISGITPAASDYTTTLTFTATGTF